MKKIILTTIVTAVLFYLIGVFATADFNISNWQFKGRIVLIVSWVWISTFIIAATLEERKN